MYEFKVTCPNCGSKMSELSSVETKKGKHYVFRCGNWWVAGTLEEIINQGVKVVK